MRTMCFVLLSIALLCALPASAQNPVPAGFVPVPSSWRASPVTSSCGGFVDSANRPWTDPSFDDSGWSSIIPPDIAAFNGVADRYYRGTFNLSSTSQPVFLYFVGDDGIEVFVNGTSIGAFHPFAANICHVLGCVNIPGCGQGFNIDVTPIEIPANLLRTGANVIAAHVSNGGGGSYFDMAVLTRGAAAEAQPPTVTLASQMDASQYAYYYANDFYPVPPRLECHSVSQTFSALSTGRVTAITIAYHTDWWGQKGVIPALSLYDFSNTLLGVGANPAISSGYFMDLGTWQFDNILVTSGRAYRWEFYFCERGLYQGFNFPSWIKGSSPGNPFYIVTGIPSIDLARFLGPVGTSNPQATVAEPVTTGNGNYFYQDTDLVIPGRGMPLVFQRSYNALDNYSGPLGDNWTHGYNIILSQTSGGTVTIKWGDGHGESFTPSGTSYVPQPGVFSTLTKNADGTFVLTRKDQTKYSFSTAGKLASIQDRNGNTILLTYDPVGNLAQVTDTVGRGVTFSYDGSNRITQITDPIGRTASFLYDGDNNLVQATDAAGGITRSAYDANHRVTSITVPTGQLLLQNTYDAQGRVVSQKNGRGFTWTFAYDTPNAPETTITDPRGNKTIHTYDSSLRIVEITDALGGTTTFTYDANNDRTSVTNPNGKATNFLYDSRGNVTDITDPLTNTVAFTYDSKNNLLTATNAKGKTTTFSYDGNGNLTTIQDALGSKTTFTYDGFGELTSKTDPRGNITTFAYDAYGNLTRIADALGNATTLNYDGIGRLGSITDANGHAATAAYDALSRLVKITDPLASETQFAYDAIGNLLKITDANSNATSYAYGAVNNLVSVTDALGHVTQYAYDEDNNRVAYTNAKGNTTSYAYDAMNRLITITDPLSFATSYAYDAVGNIVAITDAKGQTNRFTYDALNRLIAIAYADGKNVAYSYDPNGNRTTMADAHGMTTYSYDALDRLISVSHPGGKVVMYAYDPVGNRNSLTYPDGKVMNYAYDAANRLSQVADWFGRTTTYNYDAASNLLGLIYPNHAAVSFAYDAANRLMQVRNAYRGSDDPDDNPISSFTYVLDHVGNRLQVTDGSGKVRRYSYDPLYELTAVTTVGEDADDEEDDEGKVVRYTYDAVGNRLSLIAPGHSINYSYDAADRLLAAGNTRFAYDANGNQISKTSDDEDETLTYAYDAANRLVAVTGEEIESRFAYDGNGNRISQSVSFGTYNYLNDIATALPVVLQESGPDGDITYAYGLGLIYESGPDFDFFYHYDGLGSVVGLTDPLARLKARYSYDAWGQTIQAIRGRRIGTRNKFRFTGEALDPETELYYLRARYYDPAVGRFVSRDPLAGSIAFPLTANRYVYARSNPIRYRDPSGLFGISLSLFKFFTNFFDAARSADQAYSTNLQFSEQCGYTGGNIENCTRDIQLQRQAQQQAAIRKIGDTVASAPGVIYGPSSSGIETPAEFEVFDLVQSVGWMWGKVKELFTIPTAHAATPETVPILPSTSTGGWLLRKLGELFPIPTATQIPGQAKPIALK